MESAGECNDDLDTYKQQVLFERIFLQFFEGARNANNVFS
jgi:hypothetical protein